MHRSRTRVMTLGAVRIAARDPSSSTCHESTGVPRERALARDVCQSGPVPRFEPFQGLRYDPRSPSLTRSSPRPTTSSRRPSGRAWPRGTRPTPCSSSSPRPISAAGATATPWPPSCSPDGRPTGSCVADAEPEPLPLPHDRPVGAGHHRRHRRPGPGEPGAESDILPHEQTLPKPKSDRLDLLRATRANLSPIWGLSMAAGRDRHVRPDRRRPGGRRLRRRRGPPPALGAERRRRRGRGRCRRGQRARGPRRRAPPLRDRPRLPGRVPRRPTAARPGPTTSSWRSSWSWPRTSSPSAPSTAPSAGCPRTSTSSARWPRGSTSSGPARPTTGPSARWPTPTPWPWSRAARPTCCSPTPRCQEQAGNDLDSSLVAAVLATLPAPRGHAPPQRGRGDGGTARRRGPGGLPAPAGDRQADRRVGQRAAPDAAQDDLLQPQAADRHGVPVPRSCRLEVTHVHDSVTIHMAAPPATGLGSRE